MKAKFNNEIEFLKSLSSQDLYDEFHRIQNDVLAPQNEQYIKKIFKSWDRAKAKEIFGPKSPMVPELNTERCLHEIKKSTGKEQLLLQHVLAFVDDPIEVLRAAQESGFKKIIIHDFANNGGFRYESHPAIDFFMNRHLFAYGEKKNTGNPAVDKIIRMSQSIGYVLESDTMLDFNYVDEFQKLSIAKMEIAIDLISLKFDGVASKHEQIKPQLEEWLIAPGSWLRVRGASRWLVLTAG